MRVGSLAIVWIACTGSVPVARAETCKMIGDPQVVERAVRALQDHPTLIHMCEACGDRAPGEPVAARDVSRTCEDTRCQVMVEGNPIDLATTYVQTSAAEYANLALLVGCRSSGASPRLTVEPAADRGVLIQSDPKLPAGLASTAPRRAAAPAPAPPALHMISPAPVTWEAVVATAVSAFGGTALALLTALLIARRRRRALLPRALDLAARVDRAGDPPSS